MIITSDHKELFFFIKFFDQYIVIVLQLAFLRLKIYGTIVLVMSFLIFSVYKFIKLIYAMIVLFIILNP